MSSGSYFSIRRTAWMAARARNAARRGAVVAAVGLPAVCVTLALLVLVPREVNRAMRARIEALPPRVDTIPLQANLTGALDRLKNAEANLQALRVAEADRLASASGHNSAAPGAPGPSIFADVGEQADLRKELALRVARARAAPLVENFRTVGEADLLRGDPRARVLLDSLNEVNRDREAYAALGGPDARYAAMTARLSTLGQRLLLIAEQRLARNVSEPLRAAVAPTAVAATVVADSTVASTDTTTLAQPQRFSGDSVAERVAREALDSAKVKLQVAERTQQTARDLNTRITAERARAEAASPARVPLVAMLAAALVVGFAVGYGVAFYMEVRHPRVADVAEVERITNTRVIAHDRAARSRAQPRRPGAPVLPGVVDLASEAFQLLHVTLTGFGDTSREVQVMSNDPVLGATVAINLAAAAARDARATLLVDANPQAHPVERLLHPRKRGRTASAAKPIGAPLQAQVVRTSMGPELFLDTVSLDPQLSGLDELVALSREHDFTVMVQPDGAVAEVHSILSPTDVVLCARVGATRLDWLIQRSADLRAHDYRVRGVLLWATRAPSAR